MQNCTSQQKPCLFIEESWKPILKQSLLEKQETCTISRCTQEQIGEEQQYNVFLQGTGGWVAAVAAENIYNSVSVVEDHHLLLLEQHSGDAAGLISKEEATNKGAICQTCLMGSAVPWAASCEKYYWEMLVEPCCALCLLCIRISSTATNPEVRKDRTLAGTIGFSC